MSASRRCCCCPVGRDVCGRMASSALLLQEKDPAQTHHLHCLSVKTCMYPTAACCCCRCDRRPNCYCCRQQQCWARRRRRCRCCCCGCCCRLHRCCSGAGRSVLTRPAGHCLQTCCAGPQACVAWVLRGRLLWLSLQRHTLLEAGRLRSPGAAARWVPHGRPGSSCQCCCCCWCWLWLLQEEGPQQKLLLVCWDWWLFVWVLCCMLLQAAQAQVLLLVCWHQSCLRQTILQTSCCCCRPAAASPCDGLVWPWRPRSVHLN